MRHGNETPQLSWNKKQTEKSKQSETHKAQASNFRLCCSKNNVKNVIAAHAFPRKWLYFRRMVVFNRSFFSVIFLRALLIVCSARALDPQGEFTKQEIVRSSQRGWCLTAQAREGGMGKL